MQVPFKVYVEMSLFGGWYLFMQKEQEVPDGAQPERIQLAGPCETIESLVRDAKYNCGNPIRIVLEFGPPYEGVEKEGFDSLKFKSVKKTQ